MKPGIKTTEFWLSFLAATLSFALASDVLPSSGPWMDVVSFAAGILATMGYTVSRAVVKSAEARASALRLLADAPK